MSEYTKVASLSELSSGEMKMVTLGEEDILLANVDGKIHAVSDLCSHADASLSDGYIEEGEVEGGQSVRIPEPLERCMLEKNTEIFSSVLRYI